MNELMKKMRKLSHFKEVQEKTQILKETTLLHDRHLHAEACCRPILNLYDWIL
jgi:hypothetical protein